MIKIRKIDEKELESIKGGALSVWTGIAIAAIIIFISGIIEGITNPQKCYNEGN